MQLSRRTLIRDIGLGCACCVATGAIASDDDGSDTDDQNNSTDSADNNLPTGGCYLLPRKALRNASQSLMASANTYGTGNTAQDQRLGRALVSVAHFFSVNPAFGFYNENNAQASDATDPKLTGTWGTVLFGTPLFHKEFEVNDPTGMTVLAIIAHEFGHIVQYRKGLRAQVLSNQPTVKRLELHADILAGYYIGIKKRANPSLTVYTAGEIFHRIGDSDFTLYNHHGTNDERVAASTLGFNRGNSGSTSVEEMIQIGVDYVTNT